IGLLLVLLSLPFLEKILESAFVIGSMATSSLMLTFSIFAILGFLFIFLGMWMDIQDNERLMK
ncbi:hypothetical protein ACFLTE_12585, partial [Bacteroidota bacterium]